MVIEITTMIIVMPLQNNNINNNITVIALLKIQIMKEMV